MIISVGSRQGKSRAAARHLNDVKVYQVMLHSAAGRGQ
jgi:hypothetical protein